jgi:hypothetical protein
MVFFSHCPKYFRNFCDTDENLSQISFEEIILMVVGSFRIRTRMRACTHTHIVQPSILTYAMAI